MNSDTSFSLEEIISSSAADAYSIIVSFLPRLFWALVVLLVGIILANWIKSLVIRTLRAINIQPVINRLGLAKYSEEVDVRTNLETSIGEIVRWLILYLFLISVFNILGIVSIAEFMQSLLAYLPSILAAGFIFIASVLLAGFAEKFVKNAFAGFDIVTSRLMGKIASYSVVVVGSLIALSELGIAEYFINILFIGFILTLSISVGLAFGLGSQDLIKSLLQDWYQDYSKKQKKK